VRPAAPSAAAGITGNGGGVGTGAGLAAYGPPSPRARLSFTTGSRVPTEPPGRQPGFTVTVTAAAVTVMLSGEFDVASEDFLVGRLARVRELRPRRLVFQAARVTYIDCASARLLVSTGRWLPPGVKPVIAGASPVVRRVLQASGLDARCELEPCG
jgi:anti-anti-sigma factor